MRGIISIELRGKIRLFMSKKRSSYRSNSLGTEVPLNTVIIVHFRPWCKMEKRVFHIR